jgi:hypothetical protein
MQAHGRYIVETLLLAVLLGVAASGSADPGAITGTWALDEETSGSLNDEINQLKQEHHKWTSEHGSGDDPNKPSPFDDKRKFSEREWDSRRTGPVSSASVAVRQMVTAESLKLYVSDRIVVAYDGKLKRLINPNPAGRVHSATGKGISKDAVGETLAYFEDDAFVIETRSKAAERLAERFELTPDDRLKVTTLLKNPEWRRTVEFVRYYDRD